MEPEGRQSQTAAQWVKQHSKHKKNIRLVLMELAAFIDAGNNCPSHNDLASETGLSKPTIQRALAELETDGTIASVKNGGEKKNGGKKNCYTLPGMHPGKIDTRAKNTPVKLIPGQIEPGKIPEDAPVYVSDAAGEKDLSEKQKEKTTTTTVVVVQDDKSPPNEDDRPLSERPGDLGEVARAFDKYIRGTMTSTSADTFGVMIEDFGAAKVVEAFKAAFGKNDPWAYALWWLKNPQIVDKPKPAVPVPKQFAMISKAEVEAARRAFNFDVPEFSKIGTSS